MLWYCTLLPPKYFLIDILVNNNNCSGYGIVSETGHQMPRVLLYFD